MMDAVQQLYRDSAEYDLVEHAAVTEAIPFWIDAAKRYKARRVLELASGKSGRSCLVDSRKSGQKWVFNSLGGTM